jgi:hypothetical protein
MPILLRSWRLSSRNCNTASKLFEKAVKHLQQAVLSGMIYEKYTSPKAKSPFIRST